MDAKSLLTSKTFWGAIMMLLSTVLMFFKIDLGDTTEWVNAITGISGFITTIVGRFKAVKKITSVV